MAINQEDLAFVREAVLACEEGQLFKPIDEGYTNILLCNPEKFLNYRLEYINSIKIPDGYKKEFKYPVYISYHSILYGVLHNEYGVVVKQIKRSYSELLWREIISKDPYKGDLTEIMFIPDNSAYHLDWYKVSEGYNLDGLPDSCMKGKGDRFIPLDKIAEMAVLVKDSTNQMVARCIVWNKGVVERANGERIDKDLYDRLYYVDGYAEKLMIQYLEAKDIESLYNHWNGVTFNLRIKNPFTNGYYPWMDTFNLLAENDYLYCYDWQDLGYNRSDIRNIIFESMEVKVLGALLTQDGSVVYGEYDNSDEDNGNYSNYEERYIPTSRQVYSDYMGDILTGTEAFISSYDGDWYPINGKEDIWLPIYTNPENKENYVTGVNTQDFYYWKDRDTREQYLIPRDDAVTDYIRKIQIPKDRAIYIRSRNVYVSKDHKLEDVLDYFAKDNKGHLEDIELEVLKEMLVKEK
jgi:hypothetical protein